ncbi:hypothetical protein C0J52_04512 [Blattella germanica]|nr:hypothetical protein C0J52_04512 [Blattella germanica]
MTDKIWVYQDHICLLIRKTGNDLRSGVILLNYLIMPRKNTRRRAADNSEENMKQLGLEAWQDPAMLQSLANLIKESVRSAIIAELKSTLKENAEVIRKLEAAVTERDKTIVDKHFQNKFMDPIFEIGCESLPSIGVVNISDEIQKATSVCTALIMHVHPALNRYKAM